MIKKAIMTMALVSFASVAFGAASIGIPTGVTGFNTSNNVKVGYDNNGGNTVYSISSKHDQGNRIFGTTSASTAIYGTSGTPGTALATSDNPNTPGSPTDSTMAGGAGNWSAM